MVTVDFDDSFDTKVWSVGHIIIVIYINGVSRGKEMSLCCDLGHCYKLPKSGPNAVYWLPNAVFLLLPKYCLIAANIVWAGQCDNSLFLHLQVLFDAVNEYGCKG